MLPKNKLRDRRLERLKIFDGEETGSCMRNVVKRFDNVAISPPKATTLEATAEPATEVEDKVIRRATRQDDTPPLGSLGGQLPKALYVPKVKVVKVKEKKPAPGQMRLFDSEGKEWVRRRKTKAPTPNITLNTPQP
jgi:hypothetical protein